ncbi:hypothetical protein Ptr86124_003748 [Pyrenophora tritici-repentis]|uniref:Uncharacterized protein n=1 Tax=Pyrenophora tritici-repentis TaxID=45151 RepID=A0A922NMQ1_9PLEO|nr:hypothetical protein Ptr86124_003748 [Pyrenophora tritici-repentis]
MTTFTTRDATVTLRDYIGELERLSELSSSGQKAFKEDLEYYQDIATYVRTIKLPTLSQQLETESFYEDSPLEESLA